MCALLSIVCTSAYVSAILCVYVCLLECLSVCHRLYIRGRWAPLPSAKWWIRVRCWDTKIWERNTVFSIYDQINYIKTIPDPVRWSLHFPFPFPFPPITLRIFSFIGVETVPVVKGDSQMVVATSLVTCNRSVWRIMHYGGKDAGVDSALGERSWDDPRPKLGLDVVVLSLKDC